MAFHYESINSRRESESGVEIPRINRRVVQSAKYVCTQASERVSYTIFTDSNSTGTVLFGIELLSVQQNTVLSFTKKTEQRSA